MLMGSWWWAEGNGGGGVDKVGDGVEGVERVMEEMRVRGYKRGVLYVQPVWEQGATRW